MTNRDVTFTDAERARMREVCRILGTSYSEFIRQSTLAAIDEVLGIDNELANGRPVSFGSYSPK